MDNVKRAVAAILIIGGVLSSLAGCGRTENIKETFNKPDNVIELEASVSEAYGDAKAIVTIISDDGFYATAENLNELFAKRDLKCTVAGAISIVEPELDSWKSLLQQGNIDLVSHSYNHIRMEDGREIAQDVDALRHEIVDADKWYEETFGNEQIVFVCPENQMCEIGYKILEENGFYAVRRGHRGYNSLSPQEGTEDGCWFNLMVQGIQDEGVDLSVRNGWIDTAVSDSGWLIEMWHNVMPEDDGGYQTLLISDAEEHLDYVKKKSDDNDIWVATFDEAVKYIREKQNVNVMAYIDGDELHVYAELTNDEMSYDTFCQPLTVHIDLPDGISVGDGAEDVKTTEGQVVITVVPGVEQIINITGV